MDTAELLRLLEKAIAEKEKSRRNYEGYIQGMNNKTLAKLVQGVLERETGHLEFLNSFRDSIRQQGDLDAAIGSAEQLLKNSPGNDQQLELLRTIIAGAGVGMAADESQREIRREEETVQEEVFETPFVNPRASQQHRQYPRSYQQQNRSVVSCHFNDSRSVNRKSR